MTEHPTRRAAFGLLIALLLCILPSSLFAQDNDATGDLGPEAQEIARSINDIRVQNGLNALSVHSLLNRAAQDHVNDLIANGMYGHYGSDGSTVRMRVLRTGYPHGWVSENWVTTGGAAAAMDWWMNDWIHRVNILDASWDEVGIGVGLVGNGYYIFVTDFANTDGQVTVAIAPVTESVSVEPSTVPSEGLDYEIRAGDTLLAIGLRYGLEWQDIAVANGIGEFETLQIGRMLRLPGIASAEAANDLPTDGMLYTVKSGDTLSTIADRHAIAWQDIAAANRLSDATLIQIGMQLRLPGVAEESEPDSVEAAVPTQSPAKPASGTSAYTVKAGDTLVTIAARNGLTWQELAAANALDEDEILQIGRNLVIPTAESAATTDRAVKEITTTLLAQIPEGRTYTVRPGDTIIAISVRLDTDWGELLRMNGLEEDTLLQPGQVLRIQ
jgi:LysM repeat protein